MAATSPQDIVCIECESTARALSIHETLTIRGLKSHLSPSKKHHRVFVVGDRETVRDIFPYGAKAGLVFSQLSDWS